MLEPESVSMYIHLTTQLPHMQIPVSTFKDSSPAIFFSGRPTGQWFLTCSVFLDMFFSQPLLSLCSVCLADFTLRVRFPCGLRNCSLPLLLFFSLSISSFLPSLRTTEASFSSLLEAIFWKREEKEKLHRDGQKKEADWRMNGLIHRDSEPETNTEATSAAHGALSLSIITALFMNLLWFSYLVNYVSIQYEIYKVAGCPSWAIDCQALSSVLSL